MAQLPVFLSHSTKDAAFVSRVEADLRAAGATVYRISADQGGDFLKRINEALRACEFVVLALTKDALASPWVEQEIHAAIGLKNQRRIKDILPIQGGPVDYRDIPPMWGVYNIFDASRDYTSGRDGLLRALGLPVRSSPPPAAPSTSAPSPARSDVEARQASPAPISPPRAGRPSHPREGGQRVRSEVPTLPPRLASLGFVAHSKGGVEYILPPLCSVPAGEFHMGSSPKRDVSAYEDEKPQHRVRLPGFQIAGYPVTVAEYACFVRSGQRQPSNWQLQTEGPDHPVVNVSWNDAVAYATWLAQQAGQPWRLPSEAEWEKAARGTNERIYPWGDTFDKSRSNTSEGGKNATTPVGSYPSGTSPCGAQDMAGNVWEWTASLFHPYPYRVEGGRDSPTSIGPRVLRGGSWRGTSKNARAACRNHRDPDDIGSLPHGFRLLLAVPGA